MGLLGHCQNLFWAGDQTGPLHLCKSTKIISFNFSSLLLTSNTQWWSHFDSWPPKFLIFFITFICNFWNYNLDIQKFSMALSSKSWVSSMTFLKQEHWQAEPVAFERGVKKNGLHNVGAHFCESISKSSWGRKPNKNQGPKAHQENRRVRKVQRKNTDLP